MGRNHALLDRLHCGESAHRTRRPEQMPGHGLHAADMEELLAFGANRRDSAGFFDVSTWRRRVRSHEANLRRRHAGIGECMPHGALRAPASGASIEM